MWSKLCKLMFEKTNFTQTDQLTQEVHPMKRKTIMLMATLVYTTTSVLYPLNVFAYTSNECCFKTSYWGYVGYSRFIYSGPLIERGEEAIKIRVSSISREYRDENSNEWESRPSVSCMPYTDEHGRRFTSEYGSFCVGDTIWVNK